MRRYILPLALAGALLSTGCGPASNNDNNSVEKCIQGRTLDCTCPDGSMGTQTCNASGTFDACMCEATNNTSANNTSANNTSVNNTSVNNTSANNTSVSSGWDVVIDDYKSIANKTDFQCNAAHATAFDTQGCVGKRRLGYLRATNIC